MVKLLIIMFISLGLALLCDYLVHGTKSYGYTKAFEKYCFYILAIVMILFVGVRVGYNDTMNYAWSYHLAQMEQNIWRGVSLSPSASVGFVFIQNLMAINGISVEGFILLFSIFDVGVLIWFIRKYSQNLFVAVFLCFTVGCYTFCMAAMMQCTALMCCLIGVDCLLERKSKIQFVFWVVAGMTFHVWCVVFLCALFFEYRPWTWKTYAIIAGFGVLGIAIKLVPTIIFSITSRVGEGYSLEYISRSGVNIFRFLVSVIPIFISFMEREYWNKNESRVENIIVNLSLMHGCLMWLALFGTANLFGRLANYFQVFQVIGLPILFDKLECRSKRLIICVCMVGYIMYFIYENRNFDIAYCTYDVLTYIEHLFDSEWFPFEFISQAW